MRRIRRDPSPFDYALGQDDGKNLNNCWHREGAIAGDAQQVVRLHRSQHPLGESDNLIFDSQFLFGHGVAETL